MQVPELLMHQTYKFSLKKKFWSDLDGSDTRTAATGSSRSTEEGEHLLLVSSGTFWLADAFWTSLSCPQCPWRHHQGDSLRLGSFWTCHRNTKHLFFSYDVCRLWSSSLFIFSAQAESPDLGNDPTSCVWSSATHRLFPSAHLSLWEPALRTQTQIKTRAACFPSAFTGVTCSAGSPLIVCSPNLLIMPVTVAGTPENVPSVVVPVNLRSNSSWPAEEITSMFSFSGRFHIWDLLTWIFCSVASSGTFVTGLNAN